MIYYFYYDEEHNRIYVIGTGKVQMMKERTKSFEKGQRPTELREVHKQPFRVYIPERLIR